MGHLCSTRKTIEVDNVAMVGVSHVRVIVQKIAQRSLLHHLIVTFCAHEETITRTFDMSTVTNAVRTCDASVTHTCLRLRLMSHARIFCTTYFSPPPLSTVVPCLS